jgi:ribosome-associated protein
MPVDLHDHHSEEFAPSKPSKSQRKRDANALQILGERLVALTPAQLERVPLPQILRDAVLSARNISGRGAARRQRQLIGKLMRQVDAEPIRAAFDRLELGRREEIGRHHQLERLCEVLIAGDESRMAELLRRYPATDRQRLRRLTRNAVREFQQGKPLGARRALFRYLREIHEAAS